MDLVPLFEKVVSPKLPEKEAMSVAKEFIKEKADSITTPKPVVEDAVQFIHEVIDKQLQHQEIEQPKEAPKKVEEAVVKEVVVKGEKGDPGPAGKTVLFRKTFEALEWKYTDEKDWRTLLPLDELKPNDTGINEELDLARDYGGGGHMHVEPEFQTIAGELQYRINSEAEWTTIATLGGGEEDMQLARRIDMVDDYIYKGEAAPGADEGNPVWRITRTYIAPTDGDVTTLYAEGNSNFDNTWDDHLMLNYS